MSKLLVISGPIAAGKSTVASALAATFRKSGRSVAVVDLDRLYMMLDDPAPMSDPSHSREARRAAAALTDHFVLDGIELVILEGTFWTMSEREELTAALTTLVQPVFVTLHVSVEEALRRVQADSGRRASRDPAILRASHAAFGAVSPIPTDAIIDSSSVSADAVSVAIIAALEHLTAPEPHTALFQDSDCLHIPAPDLEAGLDFYRGGNGSLAHLAYADSRGTADGGLRFRNRGADRAAGARGQPVRDLHRCRRGSLR